MKDGRLNMDNISRAIALKTELDTLRPIQKDREAIIMQKFRLDWDYHSNHLEGNSLTHGETKALILFGITAQGKPLKDHFEITGHDEAIKWVIEIVKGDYPLTEKFIRELHSLLLKEPYERPAETIDGQKTMKTIEVGKYKSTPNHVKTITGEIFRFASPEETPALMSDLVNWYREKQDTLGVNPIILSSEFHYRFVRIHPFDDGNGRIARILMNFILMHFGYPPVIIKTEDKRNYFSALQLADSGTIEPFIDYIAANLVKSLQLMISGAKGERIEEPDDLDKEIALLEKKFKSVGKGLNVSKTQEAMLEVYEGSISMLIQSFITACEKFEKFYLKSGFKFGNDFLQWSHNKADAIQLFRDIISRFHDMERIEIGYEYDKLNQEGFENFNYRSTIIIEFGLSKYAVKSYEEEIILEKPYGIQLTETEINEITKRETKRHKDKIDEILKEVEKRKS